jgi:D-xylose transport system substrate-binding protein
MKRRILSLLGAAAIAALMCFGASCGSPRPRIGVSYAELTAIGAAEGQAAAERDAIVAMLQGEMGYEVIVRDAGNETEAQARHIAELAGSGAKVLVVFPLEGRACARAVDEAEAKGVRTVAYRRLVPTSALSCFVGFDEASIGEEQARALIGMGASGGVALLGGDADDPYARRVMLGQERGLAPYAAGGVINVEAEAWVKDWDASLVEGLVDGLLTQARLPLGGLLAASDALALAARRSLRARGLETRVIGVHDGGAEGFKAVATGELNGTVARDEAFLKILLIRAIDRLAKGKDMPEAREYSIAELGGGADARGSVNGVLLPAKAITKDNLLESVVLAGLASYDEVFGGVAEAPPDPGR